MSRRVRFHPSQFITPAIIWLMLLIYFPPYADAFVGDDYVQLDYILKYVQRPLTAIKLFNPFAIGWYYRPLQNIWFLGNRLTFGYTPFAYYWLELLLHALVIAMVYRVARQMGIRPYFALAAASLFAIHKHYVDVITWISAIAIVMAGFFTLTTFSAYLRYLKTSQVRYLVITFISFLLTLLSHEEAIFLLPLLLMWRLQTTPLTSTKRTKKTRQLAVVRHIQSTARLIPKSEWMTFVLMLLFTVIYVILQITRPNLTISLTDTPAQSWWHSLTLNQIALFMAETTAKFLPFNHIQTFLVRYSYAVTFLAVILPGLWFWAGERVARLAVVWALLHLAFIYWALWTQKPELYAGRHIYNTWIGLALGITATLQRIEVGERRLKVGRLLFPIPTLLVTTGVIVIFLLSTYISRQSQLGWLTSTREDNSAKAQMKEMLPQVTDKMHLFAYRFPITPNFLRSVTQVWYQKDTAMFSPFGPLSHLQEHGDATALYYLFDWDENGRLYNLMPELQQHGHTTFLWQQQPIITVVRDNGDKVRDSVQEQTMTPLGDPSDRRLGIKVLPIGENTWVSLAYTITVPQNSILETAVQRLPDDETDTGSTRFRIQLIDPQTDQTLYETTGTATDNVWQDIAIPLTAYARQSVTIHLEISGKVPGAWANPRLTSDSNPS